ncbi:MAG: HDOD domain-containing protein [bacterium]
MMASFFDRVRWFGGSQPAAVSAAPARPSRGTTAAAMANGSVEQPRAPARVTGESKEVTAPEGSSAGLRPVLRLRLESRCALLRGDVAAQSADAAALIDLILEPSTAVIRQPPAAAQRVLSATRSAHASSMLVVNLVQADPTLAQALLRLTNSASNATAGTPCVSIADAVRRVGASGVESVVLRSMVEGLLCRPGGRLQHMVDLAWAHMVRTAPISRVLSPLFSVHPDVAFSLGLLHDVGKLVVFDQIGALRGTLRREPIFPPRFVETALQLLHEPLGGLAALEWGLGEPAAGAIATHRRTDLLPFADDASQLLYVAERADLARIRSAPISAQTWVDEGGLTVDAVEIDALIAALPVEL